MNTSLRIVVGGESWPGKMRVFREILYNVSRIMKFRITAAAHSGSLNKGEKKTAIALYTAAAPPAGPVD